MAELRRPEPCIPMPTMPKRTWSDGATGAWSVGTSDSSLLARRLPAAAVCRNRRRGKVALIGGDLQHQFTARRMSATKTIFTTEHLDWGASLVGEETSLHLCCDTATAKKVRKWRRSRSEERRVGEECTSR